MAHPSTDDDLWAIIKPRLPKLKPRSKRYPGRKPLERRSCSAGRMFVLRTGIPWEDFSLDLLATSAGLAVVGGPADP